MTKNIATALSFSFFVYVLPVTPAVAQADQPIKKIPGAEQTVPGTLGQKEKKPSHSRSYDARQPRNKTKEYWDEMAAKCRAQGWRGYYPNCVCPPGLTGKNCDTPVVN